MIDYYHSKLMQKEGLFVVKIRRLIVKIRHFFGSLFQQVVIVFKSDMFIACKESAGTHSR